ncbi:MAG: hypothetical protein ABR511_11850 [Acidimicrobiales bacterium]
MVTYRLVWQEPGRKGRKRTAPWAQILEPLQERPGDWAAIATYDGETSAYRVARELRSTTDLPPGRWEFAAERQHGGGSRLFARLVATGRVAVWEASSDHEAVLLALRATSALVASTSAAQVVDILGALVGDLGGTVVPAAAEDPWALPVDLSFGESPPLLPAAEPRSVARLRLEELLPGVVEDARRMVAAHRRSGPV